MTDIEFYVGKGVKTSHSKVFKCSKRVFNFKNLFTTLNSQFTKAIAFTLAETLIVMGIIGVVAALTLPNLNSSTGDREKVAKVKKIYQNIDETFARAVAVYGPTSEWGIGDTFDDKNVRIANRFKDFLKIQKDCGYNTGDLSCYNDLNDGKRLNWLGNQDENAWSCSANQNNRVILADGTGMGFRVHSAKYWVICVDIDGPKKGRSRYGEDIFAFLYFNDNSTLVPEGENSSNQTCRSDDCAAWILQFGNMDYLKADESGKCKNSSIVLNKTTNTTCK